MRITKPALSALAIALAAASPALAQSPSITIDGRGEVHAAPDTATITTGVTVQAATAREALDGNSSAMSELIAVLLEAGLAERDIQTSNFSVNPSYVYSDATDEDGYRLPPRIAGYEVSNTVTILVRDLDQLGSVLDQAVTVDANTINGIAFGLDDTTAALDEARRAAVEDAAAKAAVYAEALGLTLGDILQVSEGQSHYAPQPVLQSRGFADAAASAVPIQGGELGFTVTATITWALETEAAE